MDTIKNLVTKKEKVEWEFFYKEGSSTVKWTVTQYHAKNERAAPKTYSLNLTEQTEDGVMEFEI